VADARFHYLYDPLCGWCYAAAPLVSAVVDTFGDRLEIVLHGGGLFPRPTQLSDSFRRHVIEADQRIAQLTGQPFSATYFEKLLPDPATVFHSLPPMTAVFAASRDDSRRALALLMALQRAHYVDGRRIVETDVQLDVAASLGFDRNAFRAQCEAVQGAPIQAHLAESAAFMRQLGVEGFPAFAIETQRLVLVDHFRFYGRAPAFTEKISGLLNG
jgi:putative protein-disulfide isomerase